MKIAICAKEGHKDSVVADRLARAEYFIIYDHEALTFEAVENSAVRESSGAGGKAVKLLFDYGVEVVLGPEVGPKALDALDAFEMKAFHFNGAKTVKDAIYLYFENKLTQSTVAHKHNHK